MRAKYLSIAFFKSAISALLRINQNVSLKNQAFMRRDENQYYIWITLLHFPGHGKTVHSRHLYIQKEDVEISVSKL